MQWVEIINARLIGPREAQVLETLFTEIRTQMETGRDNGRLRIYKSSLVENDWSVHLLWDTDIRPPGKTELGIKIAEILRTMSMVDHSVWAEDRTGKEIPAPGNHTKRLA